MMDIINIKRLEVYAFHGVFTEENIIGQKFYVSAEMHIDPQKALYKDDVKSSVHYGEVCDDIVSFMQDNTFHLIETTADMLAIYLLNKYDLISKIIIDIEKPNAPIRHHLETVNVKIERSRHRAFLSVGSNMGNRQAHLDMALQFINSDSKIKVVKKSEVIETMPYGYLDQEPFLNGCLEIETYYSPYQLLHKINEIENKLARVRTIKWGPRTIDIDILLYDNLIIDNEYLHIPHIDMHNREFVLKPLAEIAPFERHPLLLKTVSELYKNLNDK